jgi:hypothetical protein
MENQELMKLCFRVSLLMQWVQNGDSLFLKENDYYTFRDGTIWMYPETIARLLNFYGWFQNAITQEQVTEVLEAGFKNGFWGIVTPENKPIAYRKNC